MALFRAGILFSRSALLSNSVRSISVTSNLNIKEIHVHKNDDNVVIEGVTVPSPRTELLVYPKESKMEGGKTCYLCALNLNIKHTDVLILSQFVRSDGCMLPKRITGLCSRQQKKIGKLVTMAQKAGLMINLTPDNCNKDPKKRRDYKKFNTYFDESTIFMKHIPKPVDKFKR